MKRENLNHLLDIHLNRINLYLEMLKNNDDIDLENLLIDFIEIENQKINRSIKVYIKTHNKEVDE